MGKITLNQEEIQAACKLFIEYEYGVEPIAEHPAIGILMRVIMDDNDKTKARIEAEVDTK